MKKLGLAALTVLMASFLSCAALYALPEGEQVENGFATFDKPNPTTLNITVSDKAVINFNSFNIAHNEVVTFIQPSSDASVLSRVTGPDMSQIYGSLNANGTLFLVNPNGIYFAPSANVNVNNLIASTLDISTNNFINGNYILEHNVNSEFAYILNEGRITGSNIALIASAVCNGDTGVLVAKVGTVNLTSGDKVTVSFDRRGFLQVEINQMTTGKVLDMNGNDVKDAIKNSGTIEATQVMMSAKTANDIFENAVNNTGVVKATGMVEVDGVIKIVSNGKINANLANSTANIEINRLDQDISISACTRVDDLITIEGNGLKVTYMVTSDFTLKTENVIDTTPGAILQGNNITLIARQFGNSVTPLNIDSPNIHIQRTVGDIDILESIGIGTSVQITGPPEGFGKIIYPRSSSLVLKATRTSLSTDANPAYLYGNITFYNFECTTPGKAIYFEAGKTYTFKGTLNITGAPDQGAQEYHIKMRSQIPGEYWYLAIDNDAFMLDRVAISDAYALRYIFIPRGVDGGNNYNMLVDPIWDGGGATLKWSDAANWDGNVVPNGNAVTFNGTSTKDSIVDTDFTNSILSLTIKADYTGTISLGRALTITGPGTCFSQNGGTFNETKDTVGEDGNPFNIIHPTVGSSLSVTGGTFNGPSNPNGAATAATRIANVTDLETIYLVANLGKNYVQTADIPSVGDFEAYIIGNATNKFTGIYNGYGYTISGLSINSTANALQFIGLFGYTSDATLKNIGMESVSITRSGTSTIGYVYAGGLVGYNLNTSITNCYATGSVTASNTTSYTYNGGLAGANVANGSGKMSNITNSYSTCSVGYTIGTNERFGNIGGLVGINSANAGGTANITTSYATGNVTASATAANDGIVAGGLVGYITVTNSSTVNISNSYATGNVSATRINYTTYGSYAGGLLGDVEINWGGITISNSYATGNVTASGVSTVTAAGGLVGYAYGCTYNNSFATGVATATSSGTAYAGGLIGRVSTITVPTVTNCKWYNDINASGVGIGSGTGITKASGFAWFKDSNNASLSSWTFNSTNWQIDTGTSYPYLYHQVWTWTGLGDGTTWASAANWSNPVFSGYPDSPNDKALINTGAAPIATPATVLTAGALELATGYTGTLTLGNNLTLVNSGPFGNIIVTSGTLAIVDKNLTVPGTVVLSGGAITGTTGILTCSTGYDVRKGSISAILAGNTASVGLTKTTVDTVTLSGLNTYTGTTTVNNGTLNVTGSLNGVTGTALTFTGTGTFNCQEGLNVAQGMGVLTFSAGDGTVQSTWFGSGNTSLTFSSMAARTAGATGNFVISGGSYSSTNKIVLTAQLVGFMDKGIFFNGADYAWYNDPAVSGYVRAINYSGDAGCVTVGAGATMGAVDNKHIEITGAITDQTTITILTLKISGAYDFTIHAANTVTVNGILKSGTGTSTISPATGSINNGDNELVMRTDVSTDILSISSVIAGTGGLTKAGSGTLNLTGTNTYTGATTINAGTLTANATAALGDGTNAANTLIFTGGTLQATGTITSPSTRLVTLTNTGIIDTNSQAVSIAGVISGASGLTKTGAGTLTLSGANTFTGGLTIKAGTVQGNTSANAFGGSGVGVITIGDSSGSTAATLLVGTTGLTFANPIVLATGTIGTLTIGNTGTAISTTFSGGVTGANNLTINNNGGTGTITFSTKTLNNSGTITHIGAGTGAATISAVIGSNVTGLTQNTTSSTLNLSGNNSTVSGNVTISAGTLALLSTTTLSLTGNWSNSGAFTYNTSTVIFSGTNQTITGSTTFYNLTKQTTVPCTLTFTAGTTQTINNSLILRGAADNLLTLQSSGASVFYIAANTASTNTTVSINYVSVSYCDATEGTQLIAFNSTNGLNNVNVVFPVPNGTPRYWIGVNTNWNDPANWSLTSGGFGGASVPGATETAIFDYARNGNCTVNATVNIQDLYIAGYTGTFTQATGYDITLAGDYYQSSGSFTISDHVDEANLPAFVIGATKTFAISGGIFNRYIGTGVVATPYQIRDVYDLQAAKDFRNSYFKVANDFNAGSTVNWNAGAGFEPIGNFTFNNIPRLDGNYMAITGLYINRPSTDYVGLFGNTMGGSISNFTLTDLNITGRDSTGGLIGYCYYNTTIDNVAINGTSFVTGRDYTGGLEGNLSLYSAGEIKNSYSTAAINGRSWVGGFFGIGSYGTVSNSYATGNVTGTGSRVGGFAGYPGYSSGMTITNCYATGDVVGLNYTGGFVGENIYSGITKCFATGDVSGTGSVGGFIGANRAAIQNSYSTGSVTASSAYAGGFFGILLSSAVITNCYSTGNVNGTGGGNGGFIGYMQNTPTINDSFCTGQVATTGSARGGFIGSKIGGTISATSFWYYSGIGPSTDTSQGDEANVTRIDTSKDYFKDKNNAPMTDWDFVTTPIWNIDTAPATYPYLQGQVWTWTGLGDGTTWESTANWDKGYRYPNSPTDKVIINTGSAMITTPSGSALTIGALMLASDFSGTLTLGNTLTTSSSFYFGYLSIGAGTLNANGKAINVGSTWYNSSIYTHGDNTVTFTAASGTNNITTGGSPFYNLTINGSGGTFAAGDDMTVANNFTLTNGTFTAPSGTMYVKGNWLKTGGVFTHNSGTVNFNGTANEKTITAGSGGSFYNISFTGTNGEWTLQDTMTVAGAFVVTNGKFISGANTVNIEGVNATYLDSNVNTANTTWSTNSTLNIQSDTDHTNPTLPSGEIYFNLRLGRYTGSGITTYTLASSPGSITGTGTIDDVAGEAIVKLTITAAGINKTYDGGTVATVTLLNNNIFTAYIVTNSYASASFISQDANTGISVTAIGLDLGGAGVARFALTSNTALTTANIDKRTFTASLTGTVSKTYDGDNSATLVDGNYTFTNLVTGERPTMTKLTGTYSAGKNVGTGLTVATTLTSGDFTDTGAFKKSNYNLPAVATYAGGAIIAKALTVSGVTANNKVYDGNATATLNCSGASLVGKINGDTANLNTALAVGTFATKDVGNNIPITVSGMTIDGADIGNYSLSQPTGISANITPNAPKPTPTPSGQSVPIQILDQLSINPFLSTGGTGAMMMMTPGGGVVIVAAPTVNAPALTPAPSPLTQSLPPITHMPISPDAFNGATSIYTTQPTIAPDTFINANLSAQLPAPAQFIGITAMAAEIPVLSPTAFANIAPSTAMPTQVRFENMNIATTMPQIAAPNIFSGVNTSAQLPGKIDFGAITAKESTLSILPANAFNGAIANCAGSTRSVSFEGAENVSMLPAQPVFEGIKTEGAVSQSVRAGNFTGAVSMSSMPEAAPAFAGVKTNAVLPEAGSLIFRNMDTGKEIKVMFPDGNKIVPTYNIGVPLGAEKPLMEPKIREEEKR